MRHNYGEPEAKSWRLAEFSEGKLARVLTMEIDTRKIVHVDLDLTDAAPVFPEIEGGVRGDLVRVRYKTGAGFLDRDSGVALQYMQMLKAAGAHEVQVEPQIMTADRVRSEAVKSASTIGEKLGAYFDAKGIDLSPERAKRLHRKAEQIQGEIECG